MSDEKPDLQAHLSFLQGIIQRLAGNSLHVKTWCITLVAAILVVVGEKGALRLGMIALLPIVVFALMDAYYLALERCFRRQYSELVEKWAAGTLASTDLYRIERCPRLFSETLRALRSFAVWPFYTVMALMVGVLVWLMY